MISKDMAFRRVTVVFFGGLIIPAVLSTALFADSPSERDQAITREFECINKRLQSGDGLAWDNVCYTETGSEQKPSKIGTIGDEMVMTAKEYSPENIQKDEMTQKDFSFPANVSLRKFEVSSETYYYAYNEPTLDVRLAGLKYGVFAAYTYRSSHNQHIKSLSDVFSDTNKINMFRIEGRLSYGDVDYEGSGTWDDIPDYNYEIRLLAGYDIPVNDAFQITPYAGFGYRYLFNDFSTIPAQIIDGVTYLSGYDRESRYFYLPIGFETHKKCAQGWSWNVNAEYDIFVSGKQKSHLEDSVDLAGNNAGYETVANEQRKGHGIRGAVRVGKELMNVDLFVEPFVRYWSIQDSKIEAITLTGGTPVGYGFEPKNDTTEYGIKMGAKF